MYADDARDDEPGLVVMRPVRGFGLIRRSYQLGDGNGGTIVVNGNAKLYEVADECGMPHCWHCGEPQDDCACAALKAYGLVSIDQARRLAMFNLQLRETQRIFDPNRVYPGDRRDWSAYVVEAGAWAVLAFLAAVVWAALTA
jgi:hypothetical protein